MDCCADNSCSGVDTGVVAWTLAVDSAADSSVDNSCSGVDTGVVAWTLAVDSAADSSVDNSCSGVDTGVVAWTLGGVLGTARHIQGDNHMWSPWGVMYM